MGAIPELHVVYGNGPVGTAVVEALLGQGKRVRVVTHSGGRKHLPPTVEVVRGDATDAADARRVCAGATHVYNCTNPRDYHRWPEQFPPLQRGVLAGAMAAGAKLIAMENLYLYGPHGGVPMTEGMPQRGMGPRSTTRREMSAELFAAHRSGRVRVATIRASDLFGPHVRESLTGEHLFVPALAGKRVRVLADPDVPHSLTYAPDAGRAMVAAGADDAALGRAWHVPNAPAVTLRAFVGLVCAELGVSPRLAVLPRPVTRALLPLLGIFMPPLRGLGENAYIFYEPYIVDHSRYAAAFGDHATPLADGIRETVRWYREHAAQDAGSSRRLVLGADRARLMRMDEVLEQIGVATMSERWSEGWRFWGAWGLAFVGFPLGGLAARALVGGVGSAVEGALAGAATGAVVGAAQWLALSRRWPLSPWWVTATSAGMAVGLALGVQALGTGMAASDVLWRGLITGAGIGIGQTLVLRGVTGRAPMWGAVATLGWALGWLTSQAAGVDLALWSVFGSIGAWAFQFVTGLTLVWIMRRAHGVVQRLVLAV